MFIQGAGHSRAWTSDELSQVTGYSTDSGLDDDVWRSVFIFIIFQSRTPSTVSKLISLYKDCPDPVDFDFALAICIWKHIEVLKSGRKVTEASPFRKYVHFPNPSHLPTPGKVTVTSFQTVLDGRKQRQAKKAKIREKMKKNLDRVEAPIESIINIMEDDQEMDDTSELDDLLVQLDAYPIGHGPIVVDDEV